MRKGLVRRAEVWIGMSGSLYFTMLFGAGYLFARYFDLTYIFGGHSQSVFTLQRKRNLTDNAKYAYSYYSANQSAVSLGLFDVGGTFFSHPMSLLGDSDASGQTLQISWLKSAFALRIRPEDTFSCGWLICVSIKTQLFHQSYF